MDGFLNYILKTVTIRKKKALFFSILNDTQQYVHYDRAFLWKIGGKKPKLIGASGTTTVAQSSPLITRIRYLISYIKEKEKGQVLTKSSFHDQKKRWKNYVHDPLHPNAVWVPISSWGKFSLGFWLERWGGKEWSAEDLERLQALALSYGAAYEKFSGRLSWEWLKSRYFVFGIIFLFILILMIRIPLRVIGPCEVVSEDPVRIGAPLDGVIQDIEVKPGEYVHKGTVLFIYNKTVALNELYVSQKNVEIARAELHRLTVQALSKANLKPKEREELLLSIKAKELELKKEQIQLDLAQYNVNLLNVESPINGVISMQDPEKWEGRAVVKGEEIMMVNDPGQTIVKIWLPEDDLVPLNPEKKAEIFLNIRPETKLSANIFYISDKSVLTEKGIPSFIVEANWDPPLETQPQLGLKGTAVLYGENVSLFYWIIRKPFAKTRRFLGL